MSSKEEMMGAYMSQLSELGEDVDASLLDWTFESLGPANYNDDGRYVAASDESELNTVYTNFVADELKETDKEKGMAAITAVMDKMSGVNKKYRGVVYYLLAKHYGK